MLMMLVMAATQAPTQWRSKRSGPSDGGTTNYACRKCYDITIVMRLRSGFDSW